MGILTGGYAMSHVLGAPEGVEAQAERVFQGMRQIGERLRAGRPDVLIMLTSDHLNNFRLGIPRPFAIGTADRYTPYGDMGLPTDPVPGAAAFASALATHVQSQGFELPVQEDLRPDHGVMIPLGIVDPQRSIPLVPIYVNTVYTPGPTPPQCWRLGTLLRAFIEQQRPQAERVAILAGGGLSHWLGVAKEGVVNEDWDRRFMQALALGQGIDLAEYDNSRIVDEAGNGGLEVNAWIALAGALGQARGETVFYESIPAWASGMAGMAFDFV